MQRVTVTFEFNSQEEAIVFLGKQIPDATAAVVVAAKAPAATPASKQAVVAKEPTEKRGRGRPADPNSRRSKAAKKELPEATGASDPSPAAAPVASPSETVAPDAPSPSAAPTPASAAPVATVPSKDDLVAAMQAILDKQGIEKVMTILAKFGVEGAGQLPPEKRAEFIDYCGKVERGEIEAGK